MSARSTSIVNPARQFIAPFFRPGDEDPKDPDDLRGGKRAPRRFIDWQSFFDFGDARSRNTKKIDTKLSSILFEVLGQAEGEPTSLATRDLLRGLTMELPSGQRVAGAMQLPVLEPRDLDELKDLDLDERTPLWFYILREAEVMAGGEHLGPVGGRIVAEVIHGLIEGDGQSYLGQDPGWGPTYGRGGSFTVVDLLKSAGVVGALD